MASINFGGDGENGVHHGGTEPNEWETHGECDCSTESRGRPAPAVDREAADREAPQDHAVSRGPSLCIDAARACARRDRSSVRLRSLRSPW